MLDEITKRKRGKKTSTGFQVFLFMSNYLLELLDDL